jgi:hypothetical protein
MNKNVFSNKKTPKAKKITKENMQVFHGSFSCAEDVFSQFETDVMEGLTFLYAAYDNENYEGYAHVIYIEDGCLYEVNGSHCSCRGLEDQWSPEETTVTALLSRPNVSDNAKNNLKCFYKNLLIFA